MIEKYVIQINNMDFLVLIAVILIFILIMLSDMRKQNRGLKILTPEVKVQLTCKNCSFKEIRNFKEGDYISKVDDKKCSKCGGDMIVDLIYIETSPEKK